MALRRADSAERRPEPERRPSYVVPTEKDQLIPFLERRRREASNRSNDVQLRINLAYMLGYQTVLWDPASHRLRRARPVNADDASPPSYVTVNKIGGICERTISKLTKNVPVPECRPVSNEDDDVSAARVGSRILDHEMHRMNWEDLLTRLYFWVLPCGWGYLYSCWDSDLGGYVGRYEERDLNQGEVRLEVVPPFELIVDPNARIFEEARWCIRTQVMTKEAAWETYGKDLSSAEPGRTLAEDVSSLAAGATQRGSTPAGDFILVHQFWLRPKTKARPEGMVVTWAGNEFLEPPKPFPYEHGTLPFIQFDLLPGQGTADGRTWVGDLVAVQKDYNDARSREATLRRLMVPKLVGPAGSIDPARWGSKLEYIPYNPVGAPPSWMIPDNRWAYQHEQAMQRADQEMGERAGQAEVSQGKAPAGAPAAAILALQEADDTKLAVSAKQLAKGVGQVGIQVLGLVRQFWTEQRMVRTWSEDGRLEVARFSGANVAEQLDVHVSSESALPRSKSARAQLVMDLADRKILTDPRYILRLLQLPGTDWLMEEIDLDTKQADRENERLLGGETVEVAPWHNQATHQIAHDRLRKTVDYERATPQIRAVIDAHCEVHMQVLQGQMGQPTPLGTAHMPGMVQQFGGGAEAGPGRGRGPEYLDPMTGQPSNPLDRAAGMALPAADLARNAGIGKPGLPGQVPGISRDQQAAAIGD